jgi:putative endonuclease
VIAANVRVGREELDLIVRRGSALRIVEVKEKTGDGYGTPLEMIDARKLAHVRRATLRWLAANPEYARLDVRLEAVGIHRGRLTRVHLYEAAERW